jgi:Flp pilus assembly CpaF family ATPase
MLSLRSEAFARGARMLRTALGPAIAGHLEEPDVVEVMLNPDGRLMASRFVTITAAPSWSSISRNRLNRAGNPGGS